MLLAAIDETHKGTYDFLYLPIDFKVMFRQIRILFSSFSKFENGNWLSSFQPE